MIPRRFHFVFGLRERPQPLHLVFYLCLESCWHLHQGPEILFHCHHEPYGPYWDLIRDRLTVVRVRPDPFVAAYRYQERAIDRYRYAHHADVVRLDALIEHGGIYADIDTLFVNAVSDELLRHPCVMGRESDASLCNAMILSEPGGAFVTTWRKRLFDAFDGAWSSHSCTLPHVLSLELPDGVHVEPPSTFYKHSHTPDGVRMLLEGLDADFGGVVSLHLWSHLWWHRWRRDFSLMHAGRLTESHFRSIDTTLTVAARRFLPPPNRMREAKAAALAYAEAGGPAIVSRLVAARSRVRRWLSSEAVR